jgi:integrase
MSVYKSKRSPYWQYDFQIKGVRFSGSTRKKTKAEAQRVEAQLKVRAESGNNKPAYTWNEAADRYCQEVADYSASSADIERSLGYLTDFFGPGSRLSEIDNSKLTEFVSRRRATRWRGKLISNATVNRDIEVARAVFRRAHKTWKVDIGEMPDWESIMLKEPEGRIRELTLDEEKELFKHLRKDMHPMVQFALLTGMRMNNVITLTWRQVDFDNQILHVRTKSKKPGGDIHIVPMTSEISNLLLAQKGNNAIHVFTYVCEKSRAKRIKGHRYPYSYGGWKRAWRSALDAAGIEDFRFHDLRHTGATRTLRVSNLKVVQKMLGHSDIASTARYAHAEVDDVRKAMEGAGSRKNPGIGKSTRKKRGTSS